MRVKIIPKKLHGTIEAIPSKSHAHRILIAQKLAQIQGQLKAGMLNISSFSKDIEATKECLSQLSESADTESMHIFDCKESGSTLRFMLPTAMAVLDKAIFKGSGKLPERPISPLKEEMERHGCRFEIPDKTTSGKTIGNKETEICRIYGKLKPGEYSLAGNISSQFITGLLFALPLLKDDSLLKITTPLESAGYVDLTLRVLKDFGIKIDEQISKDGLITYKIPGNQIYTEPEGLYIEGDWSNAAFWICCGALGGSITCTGLDINSAQKDKEIVSILKSMGAEITLNRSSVYCRKAELNGIKLGVSQFPDLVPVMAAVMAMAEKQSCITDAHRLRIKESDRLNSVCDFLARLGADIRQNGDELIINGREKLHGGEADGHNDHRIVMAAAVASCSCQNPVIINGAEAVKKSYPGFFKDFAALGGEVYEI